MKQSDKNYFKELRNWYHALIGSTLGYDFSLIFGFPNREKFPLRWDDLRTLLAPVACTVIVGFGAFLWEKRQDRIKENSSDMRDVYFSMVATYLGGFVSLFCPNWYIAVFFTIISVIIVKKHYKK
jgi:hypothetical protein